MRMLPKSWLLGLLPLVAACGITDIETPELPSDGDSFVEVLDAAALESVVEESEADFDLVLLDDGLTASELAVQAEESPKTSGSRVASPRSTTRRRGT